jgi:hypothetical protein
MRRTMPISHISSIVSAVTLKGRDDEKYKNKVRAKDNKKGAWSLHLKISHL